MAFPFKDEQKVAFFSNVSTMFCLEISSSNKCKSSKRNLATHRTRARVRKILTSIYGIGREGRPRLRRAARARARARARAKYPGHFGNKRKTSLIFASKPKKTSPIEQISYRWEPKNSPLQRVPLTISGIWGLMIFRYFRVR